MTQTDQIVKSNLQLNIVATQIIFPVDINMLLMLAHGYLYNKLHIHCLCTYHTTQSTKLPIQLLTPS